MAICLLALTGRLRTTSRGLRILKPKVCVALALAGIFIPANQPLSRQDAAPAANALASWLADRDTNIAEIARLETGCRALLGKHKAYPGGVLRGDIRAHGIRIKTRAEKFLW